MINQKDVTNAIEHLLKESGITLYRIGKDTGINDNTLRRYTTGTAKIENMSLVNGIKLYNYYLKEMEKMENVKNIIEKVEAWELELVDADPDYYEREYIDGASDHFIIHEVEDEGLKVFFAEYDFVKELRDEVYAGDKSEDDFIEAIQNLNELADQYDYNKVVAYKLENGSIEWV